MDNFEQMCLQNP